MMKSRRSLLNPQPPLAVPLGLLLLVTYIQLCQCLPSPHVQTLNEGEGDIQNFIASWERYQREGSGPHLTSLEELQLQHQWLLEDGYSLEEVEEIDREIDYPGELKEDIEEVWDDVVGDGDESLGRRKRVLTPKQSERWDKGIVPYRFSEDPKDSAGIGVRDAILRTHTAMERFTCMRFVPWVEGNSTVQSTYEKYGIRPGHLKYIDDGSLWSSLGKRERPLGQSISCSQPGDCYHEIFHALGLHHEHVSALPDALLNIRINLENLESNGSDAKANMKPDRSLISHSGYDSTSCMHYSLAGFSNGLADTITKLYGDLIIKGGTYYPMMEVSLAHKCEELHCNGSITSCSNDGYYGLIDGKCGCRCVPGLDPHTQCSSIDTSKNTKPFPGGSYALPQPRSGCPDDTFEAGKVTHFTNPRGLNEMTKIFDLAEDTDGAKAEHSFCVTEGSTSDEKWPKGEYCIYRKGGTCPDKFHQMFVQYDDNNKSPISNFQTGSLADGTYDNNTRLEYCCRRDGLPELELDLPNTKPFVLFKGRSVRNECPSVKGMHVYIQKATIVNERDDAVAAESPSKFDILSHPIREALGYGSEFWKFTTPYCYYEPTMQECGGFIELSKETPTFTFSSPSASEMKCTWFIKAPSDEHVKLSMDNFNIAGTQGSCNDTLEIRYFRPGQEGWVFCGETFDRTIQSIHNTMVLHLNTYGKTDSTFTATASLIANTDLCYNAEDRGVSYDGKVNYTRFFQPCLPWSSVTHCKYHPLSNPYNDGGVNNTLLEGNYCRNPDYTTGAMPWCYIDSYNCEREYCDPCLLGTVYDTSQDCQQLSKAGLCSHPDYKDAAMSKCAKTCGFEMDRSVVPAKSSLVTCSEPEVPQDGVAVEGGGLGQYKVGDKVTYKCIASDYTRQTMCLTSGTWSDLGLVCSLAADVPITMHVEYFDVKLGNFPSQYRCRDIGAELAKPDTQEMNYLITSVIEKEVRLPIYYWVTKEGNYWAWFTGGVATWTNWDVGVNADHNAENRGEKCAVLKMNGKWKTLKCSKKLYYACQKEVALEVNLMPICADYMSSCSDLLESIPNMCTSHAEFADTMCPYTCGVCGEDSTCSVQPPVGNVVVSTSATSLSRGSTIQYSCNEGYTPSSVDVTRACLPTGQMSGKPLECIEACSPGWIYSHSNGQCVSFFKENVSYNTAVSRCEDIGGMLVMPKTSEVEEALRSGFKSNAKSWIGLTDISGVGTYKWLDGEDLIGNAKFKKDDEEDHTGDCAFMAKNLKWGLDKCNNLMPYICQVPYKDARSFTTTCEADLPSENAIRLTEMSTVELETSVVYACKDGFVESSGDTHRTCLSNGQLSGESLVCTAGCPGGWEYLMSSGNCYRFFNYEVDYDTATERCAEQLGVLVMPRSAEENKKIRSVKNSNFKSCWLGLSDVTSEGDFVWAYDGLPPSWTPWAPRQPDDGKGKGEDCVVQQNSRGEWHDKKCSSKNYFMCQVPAISIDNFQEQCVVGAAPDNAVVLVASETVPRESEVEFACNEGFKLSSGDTVRRCMANGQLSGQSIVCVRDCPSGWMLRDGQCYKYFKQSKKYEDAVTECQGYGGTLATPKTAEENNALLAARGKSGKTAWIGLNDIANEGSWLYEDGTDIGIWTNWFSGQPDNKKGKEDCAMFKGSEGKWADEGCGRWAGYFCQVPLSTIVQ